MSEIIVPDLIVKGGTFPNLRVALQALIHQGNMTHQQVGDLLGLQRTSVTNMLAGKQQVSIEHIDAVAEYLGLSVVITLVRLE